MLKNVVKGFPSGTNPYLIDLGVPLSPSLAVTFITTAPCANIRYIMIRYIIIFATINL